MGEVGTGAHPQDSGMSLNRVSVELCEPFIYSYVIVNRGNTNSATLDVIAQVVETGNSIEMVGRTIEVNPQGYGRDEDMARAARSVQPSDPSTTTPTPRSQGGCHVSLNGRRIGQSCALPQVVALLIGRRRCRITIICHRHVVASPLIGRQATQSSGHRDTHPQHRNRPFKPLLDQHL
jgi:hypothetical protein